MTRSDTESKNAPRGPRGARRLGHGAVEQVGQRAEHEQEQAGARARRCAMATAAAAAITTPVAVRWSAVMPVRRMLAPTGFRPASKLCRQRPSNIATKAIRGSRSDPRIAPQGPQDPPPSGEQQVVTAVGREVEDRVREPADEPGPDLAPARSPSCAAVEACGPGT